MSNELNTADRKRRALSSTVERVAFNHRDAGAIPAERTTLNTDTTRRTRN